jgi:hypothetical protein
MKSLNNRLAQRALGFLILITLIAASVLPAFGQTKRRRAPRLNRTTTRTIRNPPQARYYTVAAGQTIRVRMNEQISSESARVGDRFTTTVVTPVYAGGVEVIPAGSIINGRVTD